MDIDLKLKKSLFTPKFFPYLLDYSHRWEFWMGSAGSSKSYTICQKLIIRAINEPIRILVCRRYGSTIRQTCFSLFKEVIQKWKLTPYVKINETDFRITFLSNNSQIIFMGLDDENKLLSLNNIGAIFIEEAYEVSKSIVEQLNLRMRSNEVKNQQIILAWNPISSHSWLYNFSVENPPDNSIFIHSTYKDNPFLTKEYINALEELYTRNPQKARIYCDGEWGIDSQGLVFQNFKVEDFDEMKLASLGLELRLGADIGFIDPTVLTKALYDAKNRKIYVFDEFYKSGCQLDEVYKAFVDKQVGRNKIYMDSAEPRTIQYFRQMGLNVVPCIKGQGSVKARITFLQNNEIIIKPKCENVIREFSNFSYKKDRTSDEYIEDYTHEFSHSVDSLSYSFSDIYSQNKLQTLDKKLLGL